MIEKNDVKEHLKPNSVQTNVKTVSMTFFAKTQSRQNSYKTSRPEGSRKFIDRNA